MILELIYYKDMGSTAGSYGYVDLELVNPAGTIC